MFLVLLVLGGLLTITSTTLNGQWLLGVELIWVGSFWGVWKLMKLQAQHSLLEENEENDQK